MVARAFCDLAIIIGGCSIVFAVIELVSETWILNGLRPIAAVWRWWKSLPCGGQKDTGL